MNIGELKKRYDGKTIDEIEGEASQKSATHQEAHRDFISALFYLEHTKRFKENAAYKGASFAEYVDKVFGISIQTYSLHRMTYFQFPTEAKSIGVRAVVNTIKKCGAAMVPTVAKEINKENNLNAERVGEIIGKYAKAHLKKRKARPSYAELERENIQLKDENRKLQTRIKELVEQRDKLTIALNKVNRATIGIIAPKGVSVENSTNDVRI